MRALQTKRDSVPELSGYRLSTVAHCLLWTLLAIEVIRNVLIPALDSVGPFGIWHVNGLYIICDFPSIFNFTKAFWLEHRSQGSSVYSVANHLKITSAWAGQEYNHSLSFGYSPTMLLVLSPLVYFSHAMAFCIFNSAGLLAIWWQTQPIRCRFGLGVLAFLSPLSIACFQQGQTALLTGAGLLFLFERSRNGFERIVSWQTSLAGPVLWALTAKPPLALTAVVVLLGLRQWRPVLLAALLVLITTLSISPMLGPGWITDYIHLITTHNRIQADQAFAFSHFPQHMANLRGVLSIDGNLPDDVASRISSTVWLAVLTMLVAAGPRLRLTVGGFWSVGLLFYLLFCPHVSSFEVLQVVLLLPFCIHAQIKKLSWKELVLLFMVPLLPYASPVQLDNRIFLFSGMLFLLVFISVYWRKSSGNCAGVP
ncbi:MAG: hypothetical protein CXR31_06110 [Geobacter sp.]|nr:MAG: hypothetical protein CXR31_06110 [Geobacter sp.]